MRGRLVTQLTHVSYGFVFRAGRKFYLHLGALFTIAVILDASFFHLVSDMEYTTFDTMMRNRITYQTADPDVVIVDIDEGSLAAMAKEYGRWPWPRQVFAEFVENLEEQHPEAVIFDVLFSDPDIYNRDSDDYFNEVIATTDNTFFPMVRLNPKNDGMSEITPRMIPGMSKTPGESPQDRSIALILPHFTAILETGRIGTNNILPEDDGIVRKYAVFQGHHGWRIPSLPGRIGEVLEWELPEETAVMINWRGGLGAFTSARFSDVYEDFLRRNRERPQDEFKGKVVILGSTAPALFDTKPTPMEKIHPGVEILATAIDNFKNKDWITPVSNPWLYSAVAIVAIWLLTAAFFLGLNTRILDATFAASEVGLIVISYASLNLSTYFVDLTAPITAGFAYYCVARGFAYVETNLGERRVWLNLENRAQGWQATLVAIFELKPGELKNTKSLSGLKRRLNAQRDGFTVEVFPSTPAGIGRAYGNRILIYYVAREITSDYPAGPEVLRPVLEGVKGAVAAVYGSGADHIPIGFCQGAMPYGSDDDRIVAWKRLMSNALLDMEDPADGFFLTNSGEMQS